MQTEERREEVERVDHRGAGGTEFFKRNRSDFYSYSRKYLNKKHGEMYDSLVQGMLNYDMWIMLPGMPADEFKMIWDMVMYDCPFLFYVKDWEEKRRVENGRLKVKIIYRYTMTETDRQLKRLVEKCRKITDPWQSLPDEEKVKSVYTYLRECVYDKNYKDISYLCTGPLFYKKGVCKGIAGAAKLLCDFLGVTAISVRGLIDHDENRRHAWNMIYTDRTGWFHQDITFDLKPAQSRHFRLSTEQIRKGRSILTQPYPLRS